ncbi:hypothetical protein JQ609_02125 [Bradyrhizobium sp. AUGA SZCCT0169]|uniref:YybH family protein n=1 Tax=Bradyrhizobium sp. AUGA SZCCT0169 TaxID=2807663 RepID=UPI001BAB3C04|nr:hypothetical protein [Bradyrhizobium sp. AUGA SZCCT0169]MBR1245721.1 hypothetical protein [Bradyrhizobium sp. AUGA SZCCT0169]
MRWAQSAFGRAALASHRFSCMRARTNTTDLRSLVKPSHEEWGATVFFGVGGLGRSRCIHNELPIQRRGRQTVYDGTVMSRAPDDFDPLAVVIDWLDACRSRDLNALLDLYEERAILECDCEGVRLTGREPLSAYWSGKLQNQLPTAFTLDDLTVTEDGIWVDYRNNKASLVRAHFRFSPSGKIERTHCGPLERRLSA